MEFIFGNFFIGTCVKIFISAVVGIILGVERKNHLQAIGMRTLLLISVSCALMGVLSFWGPNEHLMGDPMRIAAGVLTGIGFIGGGAIMQQGLNIKGITTAAVIWTTAALGLAIGFGLYIPALIAFALALVGLRLLQKIEDVFFPAAKVKKLSLVYKGDKANLERIKEILKEDKIIVRDINFSNCYAENLLSVTILVNTPDLRDFEKLSEQLRQTGDLQKFSFGN